MFKKKYFLISILIVFIISIGFVSASNTVNSENNMTDNYLNSIESPESISADDSVDLNTNYADTENLNVAEDNSLQSGDGELLSSTIKPSGKTFNDIQKAVDKAKAKDVIELDGSYTGSGKVITVKKTLTFTGVNGATLNAKKLSGIFYIPAKATVTFKNIKFINGVESAIYGASNNYLDDYEVNLNIDNCSFENNYNDYYAGAVYAHSAKVSNSNFTGNYVKDPEDDGTGTSEGGAIAADEISLTNCNFIKNSAQLEGGAVKSEKSLEIVKCTFKQNSAKNGGAVYGLSVTVKDSVFESNTLKLPKSYSYSEMSGGAIHCSDAKISNSVFKSNSANMNGGEGGALYGYDIDVKNSRFEKNTANYAGAIYAYRSIGEDDFSEGILKIKNCSFVSNNEAAVIACKAIVDYGSSSKTFKNKTLDNNLNEITFLKASVNKLDTVYCSGKTIKIKVLTTPSSKPAQNLLLLAVAKSSKKKYSLPILTNSKGIATLKASKLNAGKYKVSFYEAICIPGSDPGDERYVKVSGALKTTTLKVTKAKTIVKAPKVKNKFKKSKYFKVAVKHKTTKKPFKNLKLKLKVYTGKKSQTYKIKTNKKGVAKFNTKKLKWGKHKVKISSNDKNVKLSKTSSIRIR
jgi:predicted outer membrane repeat protein